jgi:membrane fusion protein, copper/silver efflux system
MKKDKIRRIVQVIVLISAGIILGWVLFHTPGNKTTNQSSQHDHRGLWTCSMHPQIRLPEPGKCPLCGMDLIPLVQSGEPLDPAAVQLSEDAMEIANISTSRVTRKNPVREVRLFGKIQADERLIESQTAHIGGRIEKLNVNFTGVRVRRGDILAVIFSPELITAQQELIEASKYKDQQPEIYEASKEKLHLWKITDAQIAAIENSGIIRDEFEVVANTSGIVTEKRVNNGDHIAQGAVLFEVVDLSRVWVLFDAYESDLQFLNIGDELTFTVQALPGSTFKANIQFIDPVIDPVTRVAKIRVELQNHENRLKPEMFVTGTVKSKLNEFRNHLVIPKSAVLWTGTRSIVYVKQPDTLAPIFKMRNVQLGPMLGNSYVITDGLKEGEEIVTQGTFSIDAAAQLEGKPSMMNQ